MATGEKGKLIIFSAPSGSGKTTLARHVLSSFRNIRFSVSACSRKPRRGETNGVDYYFLNVEEFKNKIREKAFIEWEEVYTDHFYGTLASEVEKMRNDGKHVLFDVDVVGGLSIKKQFGKDALAIFIKPPSVQALLERLNSRSSDDDKAIRTRIEKAEYELSFENQFDEVIVNADLETAKKETIKVVSDFINN